MLETTPAKFDPRADVKMPGKNLAAANFAAMRRSSVDAAPSTQTLTTPLLNDEFPPAEKPSSMKQHLSSVLNMEASALRGVPLTALLRGRAKLFADGGKAAREDPRGTYAQSRPVTRLDYFCSHSWACPQAFKYLALVCHFNLKDAIVATAVFHTIAFAMLLALSEQPWMKSISITQQRPTDLHPCDGCHTPLWCSTFGPVVFMLVLATAHHFRKTTSLFLDICCISQDDEEAKAVGIASIGAILDRSQRMLALVSADYFERLWCVFEVAGHMRRAGRNRLDLVPLNRPIALTGFVVFFGFFYAGQYAFYMISLHVLGASDEAVGLGDSSAGAVAIFATVLMTPGLIVMLHAAVEGAAIRKGLARLHEFDLRRDAKCYSETDREALLAVIAEWNTDKQSGEAQDSPSGLQRLGVHRFESFVRFELAPEIAGNGLDDFGAVETMAILQLSMWGFGLDLIAMPGMTVYDVWSVMAMNGVTAAFGLTYMYAVNNLGAVVVGLLREKAGFAVVPAYATALVLCIPLMPIMILSIWLVPFINQWASLVGGDEVDPSWRCATDDGLDPLGRQVTKWQIYLCVMGCLALVTRWW